MDESKTAEDGRIDLGEDSIWLRFKIAGMEFETEAFEAEDVLAENDRKHISDPHTCGEITCKYIFSLPPEMFGKTDQYACPKCGSKKVIISQLFLDGVKKILCDRFGVPRCSRGEAANFYNAVVKSTDAAKKKPLESLGLDSGLISTPINSATASGGLS